MAAAGGNTVVPTNWIGLILTFLTVAIVAGVTYVAIGMFAGDSDAKAGPDTETTLEELYSSSASRGIAAMDTVRALPRTALAPTESLPPPVKATESQQITTPTDPGGVGIVGDAEQTAASTEEDTSTLAELGDQVSAAVESAVAQVDAAADSARESVKAGLESAGESVRKAGDAVSKTADKAVAALQPKPTPAAKNEALDTRYRATTAALRSWWTDSAQAGSLAVRFVGPLDTSVAPNGLAILFDQPIDPATAASFITLRNAAGRTQPATWQPAQNPNMIYTANLAPGKYELSLDSALPSRNGLTLGQDLNGPAFVN